jgi:hypothetical protein
MKDVEVDRSHEAWIEAYEEAHAENAGQERANRSDKKKR